MTTGREKANGLRNLHRGGSILVLPHAWDAVSARIFASAGFPALAASGPDIAAAGDDVLETVRRIASAVSIPVTVDLEAGYAADAAEMRDTTRRLLETGAAGLNLEDGLLPGPFPLVQTSHHVEKIRAAREACRAAGADLVINARTDIYLKAVGEPANRLAHAVHRGNTYLQAGADSIFIPGVRDAEAIAELARLILGPIDILAAAGCPSIAELQRLGVSRVTFGSASIRAALGLLESRAGGVFGCGTPVAKSVTAAGRGGWQ